MILWPSFGERFAGKGYLAPEKCRPPARRLVAGVSEREKDNKQRPCGVSETFIENPNYIIYRERRPGARRLSPMSILRVVAGPGQA